MTLFLVMFELDAELHLENYLESDCITCLVQLLQFLVTVTRESLWSLLYMFVIFKELDSFTLDL